MALEMRHCRDSRRVFLGDPGDVARPISRLLFDEPRWFGAVDFFGRPSALSHALEIKYPLLCLHWFNGRLRFRGRDWGNDQYRDALRLHPGLHRRLDHPRETS